MLTIRIDFQLVPQPSLFFSNVSLHCVFADPGELCCGCMQPSRCAGWVVNVNVNVKYKMELQLQIQTI